MSTPSGRFSFRFKSNAPRPAHPGRVGRVATGALYPILALLPLMELNSPGSLERVATQPLGAALLAALGTALALASACELGAALFGSDIELTSAAGHARNAFLHATLAGVGLGLVLAGASTPGRAACSAVVLVSLLLFGLGAHELFSPREGSTARDAYPYRGRRERALQRRDPVVRGLVFMVLGAALVGMGAQTALGRAASADLAAWDKALLLMTSLALAGYGVHAMLMLGRERRPFDS
jgi:hypothetical protein